MFVIFALQTNQNLKSHQRNFTTRGTNPKSTKSSYFIGHSNFCFQFFLGKRGGRRKQGEGGEGRGGERREGEREGEGGGRRNICVTTIDGEVTTSSTIKVTLLMKFGFERDIPSRGTVNKLKNI
jgi:hypothetical protein